VIHVRLRIPLSEFELSISLDLERPVTALFGPSGVGKTTFLEAMAGLRRPLEGEIRVDDEIVYSSDRGISLAPERRRFGFVPQDALLFPHLDVRANLLYGFREGGPGESGARALSLSSVSEALEIGHRLTEGVERLRERPVDHGLLEVGVLRDRLVGTHEDAKLVELERPLFTDGALG